MHCTSSYTREKVYRERERVRAQRVREGQGTLKDLVNVSLFAVELTIVAGVCAAAIRHRGQATLLRRERHSLAGGKLLLSYREILIARYDNAY